MVPVTLRDPNFVEVFKQRNGVFSGGAGSLFEPIDLERSPGVQCQGREFRQRVQVLFAEKEVAYFYIICSLLTRCWARAGVLKTPWRSRVYRVLMGSGVYLPLRTQSRNSWASRSRAPSSGGVNDFR